MPRLRSVAKRPAARRAFLGRALLAAASVALFKPWAAFAAWNKEAFGASSAAGALKALGASGAAPSRELLIEAPQLAENGGVVPLEITSNIPGTRWIAVVVDKNPFPLAGRFEFMEGALPYLKLNVKMAESSVVRVVAEAGGKTFLATREIKVTIGGCGV